MNIKKGRKPYVGKGLSLLASWAVALALFTLPGVVSAEPCNRRITAKVVALDQAFSWNRYGAIQPQGMIFALRNDVVPIDSGRGLVPGNVQLRPDKRPRPLVLRMNVHDCLDVEFENLLNPSPVDDEQPATRTASFRVLGLQLVKSMGDDGSNVGLNVSSLVSPGNSATYTFYGEREGTYVAYSAAATVGGEGDGGSLNAGLFGAVNVEPEHSEWYRSQVMARDLDYATVDRTPNGLPVIDYQKTYPSGHPFEYLPILNMLHNGEIVHSDLTAIITGPGAGRFHAGTFRPNPVLPDREQPFREFTTIYHDEIGAVQAFDVFEDPIWEHTLHSVRDGFAINYGVSGLAAELIANRLGTGPVWDCTGCKYEEFFLSSWPLGDPAMVVDVPANAPCDPTFSGPEPPPGPPSPPVDDDAPLPEHITCMPTLGPKATKAFYPDDPSNVYHSYLRDHVKFRVLHGGSKEHHIHHQHTHQWLHTPDSDNSSYLDSQAIGPGSAFTLEMTYNGSGNRNQAVGDSIFHCHFYPHFAQGMWSLWRVHDVFEEGTQLNADGRPAPGSRALPDAEITTGTPIPAVVPLPTLPMAPRPAPVQIVNGDVVWTPGTGNPGYPFFIPGMAGRRAPHPPLDTIDDGGLPRHLIVNEAGLNQVHSIETRLNFTKDFVSIETRELAESGEPVELEAMQFHARRLHPSYTPSGASGNFIVNGLPATMGAPFADPCIDDFGNPAGSLRTYKAADIQLDMVLNKAGWHFPQARMLALWGDVKATLASIRPPEPLFFRANTNDCVEYHLTNLVPNYYEMDDFQVRTPTDILGQHIHLVKFDVTSSDGSANGYNYEDGSYGPGEVRERIRAMRKFNGCIGVESGDPDDGTFRCPVATNHPYFGPGAGGEWVGAQTTLQRWFADDVLNNTGEDRTLRTVYTHDHFAPSTHQQTGLYAGLVIEPQGSTWRDPETGQQMHTRFDGGPTSWRADVLTADVEDSYREFMVMQADFTLAYTAESQSFPDPPNAINPPAKKEVGLPTIVQRGDQCPGGVTLPCPEAISSEDPGGISFNYRNEPIALRIFDPATNGQASGDAGDLAQAYRSIPRQHPDLNQQPPFYRMALSRDMRPHDPFTPLMRAYEDDKTQVRVLVGAQEEGHNFSIQGTRWLFEPDNPNSGFRNSQMMGISEHFEFEFQFPDNYGQPEVDYVYRPGSSNDDLWNGTWGLMRVYKGVRSDLLPLPNNPDGMAPPASNPGEFDGVCPVTAYERVYNVVATTAEHALPGGTLVYNHRTDNGGPLHDPTALLYVLKEDVYADGRLKPGVPIEPLILRANAGDCIVVNLENHLPATLPDGDGFSTLVMLIENFNNNEVRPSSRVGLHPQLVSHNVYDSSGLDVGGNAPQTVTPGGSIQYKWYAGEVSVAADGMRLFTPVEFGATNLIPADPIRHSNKGLIGALIIEPEGSVWDVDDHSRASATITAPSGEWFREFVVIFQNDVNLKFGDGSPVANLAESEDPEDSGQKAVNYRSEPMWFRMNFAAETPLTGTRGLDFADSLSNSMVGGDPATPVFTARMGSPVRFRVLHPAGHQRNHTFVVHGHAWEELPYVGGSTALGSNPLSEWKGSQAGHGPTNHFDVLLKNGAGGNFGICGDYLWRDFQSFQFDGGIWGILRVDGCIDSGGVDKTPTKLNAPAGKKTNTLQSKR